MVVCSKCNQSEPFEGDSWCIGCSGLETLGVELSGKWHSPALRAIANDLVVSCVRGVRGLRGVSSGLQSAGDSRAASKRAVSARPEEPSGSGTVEAGEIRDKRQPALIPPPPKPPVKEQPESSEEESSSEAILPGTKTLPRKAVEERIEQPEAPVRSHPRHRSEKSRDRKRRRSSGDQHSSHKHSDLGYTSRGRRAGSKHQRHYRVLENPHIRTHRHPPAAFWESDRSFAGPRAVQRSRDD